MKLMDALILDILDDVEVLDALIQKMSTKGFSFLHRSFFKKNLY